MFQIGGELGIKIKRINQDRDIVRPYSFSDRACIDLSMVGEDGQRLHICGDNDWGYLGLEIIKPILKAGIELNFKILSGIEENNPEVILVGRNDYRILDILHSARDSEEGISVIRGVPVVKGEFDNGVKYLGKMDKEQDLPFK